MSYERLDEQMKAFAAALRSDVRLGVEETAKVATTIAAEIRFLDVSSRASVLDASPVPLAARLDELVAFQTWMELASGVSNPAIARAQVIVQNYVCFVYLGDACFRALRKASRPGSVTRRCCEYLTNNPVRAFRNAVAHSNWTYSPDFSGLVFWARKGDDKGEPMSRFKVTQTELAFWQALSRTTAYAAYTSLEFVEGRRTKE
jgi:hypothetical protein